MQTGVFGGGCFWSIQAAFSRIDGVVDTRAGYMGGHVQEPTYDQVCDGDTGHVEVVEVEFDPEIVSYEALVQAFLEMHDPTSWDLQGNDQGDQYRSVLFVADDEQADVAQECLESASADYAEDIVTEIRVVEVFWVAEDDHQDFAG